MMIDLKFGIWQGAIAMVVLSQSLCYQVIAQSGSIKDIITAADKLLNAKKSQEALDLLAPALSSQKELSAADSLELYNLTGDGYYQLQQFSKALTNYKIALNSTSVNDTVRARIYNQIGLSNYRLSDYAGAVTNIIQARNLYKQLFGTKDTKYTQTLNTLGFLYNVQAKYSEAEKTFQEARQLSFQINGGEDIQYARIANNLAMVYCRLNRFDKADELFQTSLRIKEKLSGKRTKDYANSLYNVADYYSDLGRYEKAINCIQDGIGIFNSLNDTTHTDYFKFLDYLALLKEKLKDRDGAEKLFKESLLRREKASLTDRDDYALNLLNLGNLYISAKEYKAAYPYAEKATALILKIYGKNHPTYAHALITLATIQSKQNENEQASKNFKTAVQIIQTSLGSDHIEYFNAQMGYARFLRKSGQKAEAVAIIKKVNAVPRNYLKRVGRFLSEKELSEKVKEFVDYIHEIYSFVRELPNDHDLCTMAYDLNLFYRSYILNHMQRMRISLYKAQQVNEARDEVISLHRQLENELNRPVSERVNISELESRISEKEAEISRKIGSFADEDASVKWDDIRMALAEEDAAIEFISFPEAERGDSIFYGSLVLRNGMEQPTYVDLCSESDLAAVIQTHGGRTSDYVAALYDFSNRGAAAVDVSRKSLAEMVWKPLGQNLSGVKKVYLVTDGLIHRIAFSAIPLTMESFVSDSFELVYMSSSKQVLPDDQKIMTYTGKRTLIVGGVNYDSGSGELVASRSGNQTTKQWSYLPWAAKESQDVTDIFKSGDYNVSYLKGMDASEKNVLDSLDSREGFRVLHFATHGYFKGNAPAEQAGSSYYGKGLVNSALVLSGANNASNTERKSDTEDGLLTAYAISKLDLSKTELVVLSACETALGDIQEIEGVFGMQRAFKLAGASQLILSLWQIPDRETKDFMLSFYKNWLSNENSVREAFNKTQAEFRQRFVNPYQWAGFILLE
ncbi:MAG: CHAT domain-containing tetratricopeptide repeat protein [Saprospiraceae bacterium]